jgi:tRNA(Ile)-lysidine synthase TilS/MesJ
MVISKILVLLKDNAPRLRIKQVLAVHIDYGNRPESVREAEYIASQWCADNGELSSDRLQPTCLTVSSLLSPAVGIQCRVRRIAEVTRGVTNRDQYEKVSREIRYDFYRACLEQEASDGLVSGVIFGHHLVRPSQYCC